MPDSSAPATPRPEDSLVDPLSLLWRSLDALQSLAARRGHTHPPRTRCPPECREARACLALAGRIRFTDLGPAEQLAVLQAESADLRRLTSEALAQVAAL